MTGSAKTSSKKPKQRSFSSPSLCSSNGPDEVPSPSRTLVKRPPLLTFFLSPSKTPASPSRTPASPSRTPASPSRSPVSRLRTPQSLSRPPASPSRTLASLWVTPASPLRTPASPSRTPASPSRTPASRLRIPALPSRTPASPSRNLASLLRTPESPLRTHPSALKTPVPPLRSLASPSRTPKASLRTPASPLRAPASPLRTPATPLKSHGSPSKTPMTPLRGPGSDPLPHARRPAPERTASLPVPDSAFEVLQLRKELGLKTELLDKALAAHRRLERQVESTEEEQLAELQAQRTAASKEMARLQAEVQKKSVLLDRHQVVLRELRPVLNQEHASAVDELLEVWEAENQQQGNTARDLFAFADTKDGFSSGAPGAAALEAAEKESAQHREELQRLRSELEAVRRQSFEAREEVNLLRIELDGVRSPQGLGKREVTTSGHEELVRAVVNLERQLQEARENKETTVMGLLSQVTALNSKLATEKKEREAAVHAAERKVEEMERELAAVVQRNERNEAELEKARARVVKGEEYLMALDVARVEIMRLRLERDLMVDKLRSA